MATVKTPLQRKLEKVMSKRFPPPATVRVEDHDGIIGVITSDEFSAMETIDRQKLIRDIIASELTKDERRRIQMIVAVTPDEGTGYLASAD